MPFNLRRQCAHRSNSTNVSPQQRSIVLAQPVLIARLRGIIPRSRISTISHRLTHRRMPIQNRLRSRVTHAVAPKIVNFPCLLRLRREARGIRITLKHKDVRQRCVHRRRLVPRIHQRNNPVSTRQLAHPERNRALPICIRRSRILPNAIRRRAHRILAHRQHRRICIDTQRLRRHIPDIGAHNQGAFENSPHTEMQDIFRVRHAAVADLEHIEIVPSTWLRFVGDRRDFADDVEDGAVEAGKAAVIGRAGTLGVGAGEGVVDVAGDAPAVGYGLGPVPRVVDAPVAHGVDDWAACSDFQLRALLKV